MIGEALFIQIEAGRPPPPQSLFARILPQIELFSKLVRTPLQGLPLTSLDPIYGATRFFIKLTHRLSRFFSVNTMTRPQSNVAGELCSHHDREVDCTQDS